MWLWLVTKQYFKVFPKNRRMAPALVFLRFCSWFGRWLWNEQGLFFTYTLLSYADRKYTAITGLTVDWRPYKKPQEHVFLVNHSKLWIIFYTSTSDPVFRSSAAATSSGSEAENFTCATTTSSWQGMSRGKLASNPLQCLMVQLKQRYLRYLSFIPLGQTIRNNLIKTDASVGKKSQAYPLTNKATFAKL